MAHRLSAEQLVSSPACIPQLPLEKVLPIYRDLGFGKFEAFSSWCKSALGLGADPAAYVSTAERYGMAFTSFHLPPIGDDRDAGVARAVQAARFAEAIGASVVLYKADSRENYIAAAGAFLDALSAEGIGVTPVLQNHFGTPITTLGDFREVIDGIADERMRCLLEVGHFRRARHTWREGYELLAGRIALVHVNEIRDGKSVRYGTGEVDFAGLLAQLTEDSYAGDIVVELELATRDTDIDATVRGLAEARELLIHLMAQAAGQ